MADLLSNLADRGLATDVVPADNPEQRWKQATARPHPDFLFALGLVDAPEPR